MIKEGILKEFFKEVSQNRSALLSKDFFSAWNFLGLNPDILKSTNIEHCQSWYVDIFQSQFLEKIIKRNSANEIFLHLESDISEEDLLYSLENIALKNGKTWNTANPFLSMQLKSNGENFRLTLLHPQITSEHKARAFLRRIKSTPLEIRSYIPHGLLSEVLNKKKNIIISGSTGSGKTTLAQSLLALCSMDEHLVILEDTHELHLDDKNCTHLLSSDKHTLVDYCSYALRISPDRLILGELRGKEILPLILAMNTGHNGFMTTIHADSAAGALQRLKTLLEFYAVKNSSCFEMICQNIDIVIHVENKKIREIIEVKGLDGSVPLYDFIFKSEKELAHEVL